MVRASPSSARARAHRRKEEAWALSTCLPPFASACPPSVSSQLPRPNLGLAEKAKEGPGRHWTPR
jgi:hypothetical protein